MKADELVKLLNDGALREYSSLYSDINATKNRIINSIKEFTKTYGENRDIYIFSVPGRSEIIGNHTDHNCGKAMAGAINRDIIAVAARNDDGVIRFRSAGYLEDKICLSDISSPENFRKFTSRALVAGVAQAFVNAGFEVGGYDMYSCTEVLKGSGLSSSAAFEVMVGNILNHLYNEGKINNQKIAKCAQYSENIYFGKPCGLMDQMACAVGGFVYMDFKNNTNPGVESVEFSLSDAGYSLCIVNTGGSHANLNPDYASVPSEMKAVAGFFDKNVLRGIDEEKIINFAPILREKFGDRAILRAIHFVRENERVSLAKEALKSGDIKRFLNVIVESGHSSFEYLQNVYTNQNVAEQGLSLALALTEGFLSDKRCAFRVHGGGFAGTIQAFVKNEFLVDYVKLMDSVFGNGAAMSLNIRPMGAIKLF